MCFWQKREIRPISLLTVSIARHSLTLAGRGGGGPSSPALDCDGRKVEDVCAAISQKWELRWKRSATWRSLTAELDEGAELSSAGSRSRFTWDTKVMHMQFIVSPNTGRAVGQAFHFFQTPDRPASRGVGLEEAYRRSRGQLEVDEMWSEPRQVTVRVLPARRCRHAERYLERNKICSKTNKVGFRYLHGRQLCVAALAALGGAHSRQLRSVFRHGQRADFIVDLL